MKEKEEEEKEKGAKGTKEREKLKHEEDEEKGQKGIRKGSEQVTSAQTRHMCVASFTSLWELGRLLSFAEEH